LFFHFKFLTNQVDSSYLLRYWYDLDSKYTYILQKNFMKAIKTTYWISTIILCLFMAFSAFLYMTAPAMPANFHHLGFPDYFRVELAVGKIIGVIFLLAPLCRRYKEWAYAGFSIVFISAFIAHSMAGDPLAVLSGPVVAMVILVISYVTYHRWSEAKQNSTGQNSGSFTQPAL